MQLRSALRRGYAQLEPGDSGTALLETTGFVGDARGGLRAIMVTSAAAVVRVSGCMVAGGTKAADEALQKVASREGRRQWRSGG